MKSLIHTILSFLSLLNVLIIFILPESGGCQFTGDFVRRHGDRLVAEAESDVVWLRGMGVSNGSFYDDQDITLLYANLTETDYRLIAESGMNVFRFKMNYKTFEDDNLPYVYKQEGWDWLDRNIELAGSTGIYLILTMAYPPGGFQPNGCGLDLWERPENQARLLALWKAIAGRYSNEPIIAGYDLLNEPTTSQSFEQWQELAQQLADTIRTVDKNHLLVVESLAGVWGEWEVDYQNPENVYFLINDDNVMYDFHYYYPHDYTEWYRYGEIQNYPDSGVIYLPDDADWDDAIYNSAALSAGNSDWHYYEGELFQVTDTTLIAGSPALVSFYNTGTVFFDDVVVKEYNETGQFIRDLVNTNIASDSMWYYWDTGSSAVFALSDQGHNDNHSLAISSSTDYAGWRSLDLKFPVSVNHFYSINGWMKGVNVSDNASCRMKIKFIKSPSGKGLMFRDRAFLESKLRLWTEFGRENNVPINVGEYGVDRDLFDGHGGLTWTQDMLELFSLYGVHHTYHTLEIIRHNQAVMNLFSEYFNTTGIEIEYKTTQKSYVFRLNQNFPNPFNPSTAINYTLHEPAEVTLSIYNLNGQLIECVHKGFLPAGSYTQIWLADEYASGIYFCQLVTDSSCSTIKLLLQR
ncbi:cellulase family glycosylhydrolase [bacterium]|nr:cellulase family glycosylhydrolase [bacterium]